MKRRDVQEHWLLRNGSEAFITQRAGQIAVGVVDGAESAVHTWVGGKMEAGLGYDLLAEIPSIEAQERQLRLAGWGSVGIGIWQSPAGMLFNGPHGAWKVMVRSGANQ